MLPVVASPAVVARKILFYSYVMVVATLALAPYAGWLYTAAALGLGVWFLAEAHRLRSRVAAMTYDAGPVPAAAAGSAPAGPVAGLATGGNVAVAAPVQVEAVQVDTATDAAGSPAVSGMAQGTCAGLARPSTNPAPMRLFHLSIAYLTLLFAVIAVTALLPWGSW
jgi:heme O synthase-like polyprenyltransferase